MASASCEAVAGETVACGVDGAPGVCAAAASSLASASSAAGLCDPSNELMRLLKPASAGCVSICRASRCAASLVAAGARLSAGLPIGPRRAASPAGCGFVAAATAFTSGANAVPSPKRKEANSSD